MVAVELPHQRLELAGGLRYVDPEDGRAVAVQHAGDLLADAAAGAGHQGDLAVERRCQSVDRRRPSSAPVAPMRTTWPET